MKKAILILILILVCVLLAGCGSQVTDFMGKRFEPIERDERITLCYDVNTMAVYIVYEAPYLYGISPYIMFDESNKPTIGQWNGKEIIPAERREK